MILNGKIDIVARGFHDRARLYFDGLSGRPAFWYTNLTFFVASPKYTVAAPPSKSMIEAHELERA